MKKTISISLGGTLFNIEEDGYEKLHQYLTQVKAYFQNFEGSQEIIQDIENRIAELLLQQRKDSLSPVTEEEVNAIISTMGNVSDFDSEESNPISETQQANDAKNTSSNLFTEAESLKGKLKRNRSSKYLGGVLSGLAVFLGIQAVWLRLLFLLFFFGFAWLPAIPGSLLVAYIIFWIVMPAADLSRVSVSERTLLRSEKERVIGGVCAGLGIYLGIEITIVRLLFIISILFFGTGILLYIILWIAMPKATSLSDELKMKGKPITIESIEESFRQKNDGNAKEESRIAAILLFPFRVLGVFFTQIGPGIKKVGNLLSILLGLVFALSGLAMLTMAIVWTCFLFNLMSLENFKLFEDSPIKQIINTFTDFDKVVSSFAALLPSLFFTFIGISMLSLGRIKIKPIIYLITFFLWMLSLAFVGVIAFKIERNFNAFEEINTTEILKPTSKSIQLVYNPDSTENEWNEVEIDISTWSGNYIKVDRYFKSNGKNAYEAQKSARSLAHSIELMDSTLYIDKNFRFDSSLPYAKQSVYCRILIPKSIRLDVLGMLQYKIKDFELNADELYKTSNNFKFKNDTLFFNTNYFGNERKGYAVKTASPYEEEEAEGEENAIDEQSKWLFISVSDSLAGTESITTEGSKFLWHFNPTK